MMVLRKRLMTTKIHETAIVHPDALIGDACTIGPFCTLGPDVVIGSHNHLKSHVVLEGPLEIGNHNTFFPFSVIGEMPQDLKFKGEASKVIIGDHNVFRESVTINRGTEGGGMITEVGHRNLIMAYCHIAHDCIVHNECVIANGATLAGHVEVFDHAIIGGFTAVTQFNRVGAHSYIGGGSMIRRDVLPFVIGKGHDEFRVQGINLVGLRRKGLTTDNIQHIKKYFHILVTKPYTLTEALAALVEIGTDKPYVQDLLSFCKSSKNGIYRHPTTNTRPMTSELTRFSHQTSSRNG